MIYLNKYIKDGCTHTQKYSDITLATIAAGKNDERFNMPYSHTLIFQTIREGVNKYIETKNLA